MNNTTEPIRILLDIRETARALKLSDRTVWSLANTGELRSVRIGRSRRFDLRDVHAFVERKKQGSDADA